MGLFDFWRDRGSNEGTPGDDTLRDTYRSDTIDAGAGDDVINLSYGDDQVFGREGNDIVVLRGRFEDYTVTPPDRNDSDTGGATPPEYLFTTLEHPRYGIKMLSEVEYVQDSTGTIYRIGEPRPNRIDGTDGDDYLLDTRFGDYIYGFDGDDRIQLSDSLALDYVDGGEGQDSVRIPGDFSDYDVELFQGDDGEVEAVQLLTDGSAGKYLVNVEFVVDETGSVYRIDDADLFV